VKKPTTRMRRLKARAVGVIASIAFVGVAAGASFDLDEHPALAKAPVAALPVAPAVNAPCPSLPQSTLPPSRSRSPSSTLSLA